MTKDPSVGFHDSPSASSLFSFPSERQPLKFIDDNDHVEARVTAERENDDNAAAAPVDSRKPTFDSDTTWHTSSSANGTSPYRTLTRFDQIDDVERHSLYAVWKTKFVKEHRCYSKQSLSNEVAMSAIPHVLVAVIVSAYIVVGSVILQHIDEELHELPFYEVLLFSYTTLTTIGYGHIVPTNELSRSFTLFYSVLGIPLVFLGFANIGQFVTEGYWIIIAWAKHSRDVKNEDEYSLPLKVTVLLLLGHSVVGGLIFHYWIDEMPLLAAVYFSFISITTIGFGDLVPTPDNTLHAIVIIVYLSSGIVIMSTLVSALSNHIRRVHYIGRKFRGAEDVQVWFGGASMSVRDLIEIVAGQFSVPPEKLHATIRELDDILEIARQNSDSSASGIERSVDESRLLLSVRETTSPLSAKSVRISEYSTTLTDKEDAEKVLQALGTVYLAAQNSVRRPSSHSLRVNKSPVRKNAEGAATSRVIVPSSVLKRRKSAAV